MIYNIHTDNQQGFVQFVTLPEKNDVYSMAFAAQQRMSFSALELMVRLLVEVGKENERLMDVIATDRDRDAEHKFHGGYAVFDSSNETMVTVISQRSVLTVLVNSTVVLCEVRDVKKLIAALTKAIENY